MNYVSGQDDNSLTHIQEGEETSRLAVLDMDWDNIRAVDVLAFLSSFCPRGGEVHEVTIHPTQFGMKRLEEEAKHGPRVAFSDEGDHAQWNDDTEDKDTINNDDEDLERVRQYEREKLRYYFAVAMCDSAKTANVIYRECDSTEYERSGNIVDLRFIPDGHSFSDRPVKDHATRIPAGYQPPRFETKALQHTQVRASCMRRMAKQILRALRSSLLVQAELTWDKNDSNRTRTLQRKFDDDTLKACIFLFCFAGRLADLRAGNCKCLCVGRGHEGILSK